MNAPARQFEVREAVRDHVPVLVGLFGASGSGKTFTALRLATGIQQVVGGDIHFIDTESRRALHYADKFKFKHVNFTAPFGSLDYLSALQQVVRDGAKVIVVDSMSLEHEGVGGYLETHNAELDRIAGNDFAKRERVKFMAWQKPSAERRKLINGVLQLNANFIFCFRAKEKIKIVGGKPVEQGFMPIAGEEFVFEMTVNCLLYPNSRGVPTWESNLPGERMMMKLPAQFEQLFAKPQQIDEAFGQSIAQWAAGSSSGASAVGAKINTPVDGLEKVARDIATMGTAKLQEHWKSLRPSQQRELQHVQAELKQIAADADATGKAEGEG